MDLRVTFLLTSYENLTSSLYILSILNNQGTFLMIAIEYFFTEELFLSILLNQKWSGDIADNLT